MDNDLFEITSTGGEEVFVNEWQTMSEDVHSLFDGNLNVVEIGKTMPMSPLENVECTISELETFPVDGTISPEFLNYLFAKSEQPIERNIPSIVDEADSSYTPSSLPATQNYPGEYDFNISFEKKSKGASWTFSPGKDKLYASKGASCPVNFHTKVPMPKGVKIRAMALYSTPENVSEVVIRCVNHSNEDKANNILNADHLVRCESPMASYEIDPATKRYSVLVPFENPPVGQNYSTYIYKFTCLSSCPGQSRRALSLVFSLELDGQVIGRRVVNVKICACPLRDRKTDEEKSITENGEPKKRKRKQNTALIPAPSTSCPNPAKKPKLEPDTDGYYQIRVKDQKCYEFLEEMLKVYEMRCLMKTMRSLSPDVKNEVESYLHRKGYDVNLNI